MDAQIILRENIKTLLRVQGVSDSKLARWLNHDKSWINKILSGERNMQIVDFDTVARFFGIATYQLFQPGISAVTDRRHGERRLATERRKSHAVRVMLSETAEVERVRSMPGKGARVQATAVDDELQRIIADAVTKARRIAVALEKPRRQATVARPTKAAARPSDRAASRSDDSSRPAIKLPHK